ncbi:MAG TPA: ferredoxin-NADP reductase, partial [Oscillatoriaceae cyanobacterium]
FLLPEDPAANLLMIATGTGLAPFRGFLRMRDVMPKRGRGRAFLVFGAQTSSDLLYQDEIARHLGHPEDHLTYALSREQKNATGGRMYVGDRLAELAEQLWPLVEAKNLYVYVCGIKGMEKSIEDVLGAMAARAGLDWAAHKAELVAEKRWMVETY